MPNQLPLGNQVLRLKHSVPGIKQKEQAAGETPEIKTGQAFQEAACGNKHQRIASSATGGTSSMEMGNYANNTKADRLRNYTIIARLDDAIPLNTEEWTAVERLLNQVSEFVPISLLNSLTESIISYADDQARRGYLLGQEDLAAEMRKKAARIA